MSPEMRMRGDCTSMRIGPRICAGRSDLLGDRVSSQLPFNVAELHGRLRGWIDRTGCTDCIGWASAKLPSSS